MKVEYFLKDKEIILANIKVAEKSLLEEFKLYDKKNTNKDYIAEACAYNVIIKSNQKMKLKLLADIIKKRRIAEEILTNFIEIKREYREVLEMLLIDGRTWDWVTQELNISKTTVGRRKNRGLKILEEKLKLSEARIEKEIDEELKSIIKKIDL